LESSANLQHTKTASSGRKSHGYGKPELLPSGCIRLPFGHMPVRHSNTAQDHIFTYRKYTSNLQKLQQSLIATLKFLPIIQ